MGITVLQTSTVTATISGVAKAVNAPTGACSAADYIITNPTMKVGRQIPAGNPQGEWDGATVQSNNVDNRNQDGCKNATLTFTYTSD